MKKKYTIGLFIPLVLFSLFSCNNNVNKEDEDLGVKVEERTLNFYAVNDFHGSYLYDESYSQTGLSRIGKYLIDEKTKDPENTFIISSGDMFQGGAESNITYGDIVIDAMNIIGFDAMAIGNHEFDWGEEVLSSMASKMDFPLLGFNVYYKDTLNRPSFLSPSTIIQKEGIKVGIIGAIQPGIESSILPSIADNYDYLMQYEEIKNEAYRLKTSENCDIVVLSTHDGSFRDYEELSEKFNEIERYIDALFLGHEHDLMSGKFTGTNVPYIQGKCNGEYLSKISLDLKLVDNHYIVESSSYENIKTFTSFLEESNEINQNYDLYKSEIEKIRDEVLCTFDSYVSRADFGQYIAYSLLKYVNDEKILGTDKASLGMINTGGIRSNVTAGTFTYGDLIKIYPFENVLCVMKIKESNFNYYASNTGLYRYSNDDLYVNNGYCYLATVDYVAYQKTYSKEEILTFEEITCRDIVANILKKEGYSKK